MSTEEKYWEARYKKGRSSGLGSIGDERTFKWNVINKYIDNIKEVIDVGCGDLSFWEDRDCQDYIGFDISKTIIEINKRKRPNWVFYTVDVETLLPIKKSVVFCFDVLYHILEYKKFKNILFNLFDMSNNFVFIYTFNKDPFKMSYFLKDIYNLFKTPITTLKKTINNRDAVLNYLYITILKRKKGRYITYHKIEPLIKYIKETKKYQLVSKHNFKNKAMYIFKKYINRV